MTHTYQLTGMTCEACEYKVKHLLGQQTDIVDITLDRNSNSATLTMDKHLSISTLQQLLGGNGSKYQIAPLAAQTATTAAAPSQSWLETYKPILLIFAYILASSLLVQMSQGRFDLMQFMRHFMAGFFLVFSFFKTLNLSAFAQSYAMYDVLARKIPAWGYIYAFVELGLGVAFLIDFQPFIANIVALVVMSVSIVGVLQSVLNKKQIQCACLGAVFNLPMSTVTIVEDGLMIAMSAAMLFLM